MASMELQMLIKAQNTAQKQIKQVQKQMKAVTKTLEKQQKVAKKSASVFKKAWLTKFISVVALWKAVKGITKAFIAQERAEKRLETLANNVRGTTKKNIELLKEQARAMQKLTTIGDEVTIVGQSQLATFQLQTDTIQKLTPALLDMSTAVFGVNVSQEQMITISNLLGKAMMGQTGALTRYGITMDDTQVKILQTGDEMQKASAMTDILKQNFGGLAAEMRDTLEGRIAVVKNQFSDLGEEIGARFAPIISNLLVWLSDVGFPAVNKAVDSLSEAWAKDMFFIRSITETTGFLIRSLIRGWAFMIGKTAEALDNLGNMFGGQKFSAQIESFNVGLDFIEGKITGEGTEAVTRFRKEQKRKSGDVTKVLNELAGIDAKQTQLKAGGGPSLPDVTDVPSGPGGPGGGAMGQANKAVEQASKLQGELATRLGKSRNAWRKMVNDAKAALADLEEAHANRIEEIDSNLDALKASLEELKTTYNDTIAGLDLSTAEEVIKQEQRILELQSEIAQGKSQGERTGDLEGQLKKEQEALKSFMSGRKDLDDELTEVRRRNALTEFEQFIEDQNAKRSELDTDFQTRQGQIEAERIALEEQRAQEVVLFEAKRNEYLQTLDTFNEFKVGYIDGLMEMETRTETSVKILEARLASLRRTLESIKSIQDDIKEAKSEGGKKPSSARAFGGFVMPGKPVRVNERNEEEIFTPNQAGQIIAPSQQPSTSTISINVTASPGMDENKLAKAIKTEIEKLARSMKLKTLGVPSTI